MISRTYFIALFCLNAFNFFSQNVDSLAGPQKTENYLILNYDNDFFSATDRYYTQGIQLTLVHPVVRYSPFSYTLLKLNKTARNYYALQFEQDVFTPRSIRYMGGAVYLGERPFTAIFFVSHALSSIDATNKIMLRSQLDLGIIGPEAKGEEEQKGIHSALDNIEPQGWDNQLSTDYIINYRLQVEKGLVSTTYFELITQANARLGSLYTDAGAGLHIRAGLLRPYFNNLGIEKSSSARKNDLQLYAFLKLNARLVAYNATLQGGLTNAGNIYSLPDSSISRLVADVNGGIMLVYKRVRLEYSRTYITPEFNGGLDHGWGRCGITVCF